MSDKGYIYLNKKVQFLILATVLSILFTAILSFFFQAFPDYDGYNRYVTELTSLERFSREIVSGYIMFSIGYLGGDGGDYYYLCTIFLFLSFSIYCYKKDILSVLTFTFLCLNPIMLILIHVPRFTMSLGFLMLALSVEKKYLAYIILIFGVLTHTILGLFSIMVYSSQFFKIRYVFVSLFVAGAVFIMILLGVIETPYAQYFVSVHDRGRFRLLFFIILFFLYLLMLKNTLSKRFYLTSLSLFTIALYLLSPFAHRFIVVFFILLSVEIEKSNMVFLNRVIWDFFKIVSLFGTISIFSFGLYQYEIL